jgi:pimeloyl-ACP methyl ester carboxylesterase
LGHGGSAKPDDPQLYHSQSVYQLLEDWIGSLELDEPPVLVGHSMGGYMSLTYSLHNPDLVRKLVLISPFYTPSQLSPFLRIFSHRPAFSEKALRAIPEWVIYTAMGLDPTRMLHFPEEYRLQKAADTKRASPNIVHTAGTIESLGPERGRISTRSLVIWGKWDPTLKPASFPRLVHHMPNAIGYKLKGCGHQPHISRSETVNRLMLEFLQQE